MTVKLFEDKMYAIFGDYRQIKIKIKNRKLKVLLLLLV